MNATDSNTLSPSPALRLSGSNPSSPLHQQDPKSSMEMEINPVTIQLPVSTVRKTRGRPRRLATNTPLEEPALEPIRRLRSRNTSKEISQDPWSNLSNAPALTPLSPKKLNRQERTLQRPPQRPVNSILSLR